MGAFVPVSGGRTTTDLGIQTKGGTFTPLVPRGSVLPVEHGEVFTTAADGQPTIRIDVLHGTTGRAADALPVGHYEVRVPQAVARGVPQILVTFQIDTSGGVVVTAVEQTADDVPVPVERTS